MQIEIIVSRYNEDISWTKKLARPVTVYDKSAAPLSGSIARPNYGRDSENILYHIEQNYEQLPDILICLQGDPRFNPVTFTYEQVIERANGPIEDKFVGFLEPLWQMDSIYNYWCQASIVLFEGFFGTYNPSVFYASGLEYVIPKRNILGRPKEFYSRLRASQEKFANKSVVPAHTNVAEEGVSTYALEPLLGYIFTPEIPLIPTWRECFLGAHS